VAVYRGIKGLLALGGAFTGSPLVQGAVAQSATAATFDGTNLNGVWRPGDTFTVAGDAQVYTVVTAGVIGSATPNELAITFSPAVVPGGGWVDNAAVTFVSNSVAEIKNWEATPSRRVLDKTVLGNAAEANTLGYPSWSGRAEAHLDYGDAKQKTFIDQVKANTDPSAVALTLVVNEAKQLWGDVVLSNVAITSELGALVMVSFDFTGTGVVSPNWNAAA